MLAWLGFKSDNSRHGPGQFSIIFARSGGSSRVLNIDVIFIRRLMSFFIAVAIIFLLGFSYVLYHQYSIREQVAQLDETKRKIAVIAAENKTQQAQQKAALNTYQKLAIRMQQLEAGLQKIHQRDEALPVAGANSNKVSTLTGVGGDAISLNPEDLRIWLLNYGDKQLDMMEHDLNSLSATPRGYPVDMQNTRITSQFGFRSNPFTGHGSEFHNGLDFATNTGTPVYAAADGIVVTAGSLGGLGNAVKIDHGYSYMTAYGHMSKVLVQNGAVVKAGDLIGLVGSTGRSSGPHLHYIVYFKGEAVNPLPYV